MTGWIKIERECFGHDLFEEDEFSRRDAWIWMIARAAWKPERVKIKGQIVDLDRGDLSASVREMADAWKWSKSRVGRFMGELRAAGMIAVRTRYGTNLGQTSGQTLGQQNEHTAGQGKSIITICNYAKYQFGCDGERDNKNDVPGTNYGTNFSENLGQHKREEESNNNIIPIARAREGTLDLGDEPAAPDKPRPDYAFDGQVIRLTQKDFDAWARLFHAIPDFKAEIEMLDDHYGQEHRAGRDVSAWFHRARRALGNKHQLWLSRREETQRQPAMASGGYAPPPTRYSYEDSDA